MYTLSIVYKAFLLMLNITFRAVKFYRLLRFGIKIKTNSLEMAPITSPFTRLGSHYASIANFKMLRIFKDASNNC